MTEKCLFCDSFMKPLTKTHDLSSSFTNLWLTNVNSQQFITIKNILKILKNYPDIPKMNMWVIKKAATH